jgi:hypothetical protein
VNSDSDGKISKIETSSARLYGAVKVSGWRALGHRADGSIGGREDDGRTVARVATRMAVRGWRRFSSGGKRGENAARDSAHRCRSNSMARDSTYADRWLDCSGDERGTGLLSVEASVSGALAGRPGGAGRLPEGNPAASAATVARALGTLHDGTDAREPTGNARRAGTRRRGRC